MADPTSLPPGFVIDPAPVTATPTPIIPRTPAPQTPAQASKDVSDAFAAASNATTAANNATASGFKVHEEKINDQKIEAQKDMMTEGVDRLVSSVESAKSLVNGWSTGWGAAALEHMPNTDAARLKALIDTEIKGNVFLNTIQQRQEDTPGNGGNGTPGGRILQSEVPMITGALGALDPASLGEKMTTEKLNQIAYRALRAKAILNGQNPDDPNVQKQYGIDKYAALLPANDLATTAPNLTPNSPSATTTDTPAPGVSQLTPDQQAKDKAFLATKPTPEQYTAFLGTLTGAPVDPAAAKARLDAAMAGGTYSGAVDNTAAVKAEIAREDKAGINQENDAGRLFMHGATLGLSDEAAGVGNAAANIIASPFTGNFNPVGSYQLGRDVERQRIADAETRLGNASVPIEFVGGLASGNPESAVAKAADIPTVAQVVRQGAKAGGAYGVISGYGSGQGLQNSLVGAGVGGVTGAGIGALGGRIVAGKTPPPTPPGSPSAADVAAAMQAEGIPAARPIADPSVRGQMAYLETTRGGHGPVQDSLAQTRQAIADKVAGLTGEGSPSATMGETIQEAGTRTLGDMKNAARTVYSQADRLSNGAQINPTDALAKLDGYINQLSRNPATNAGVIDYLQGIRSDLANGPKTVGDIRDIITGAEDKINYSGLQKTRAEGIMADVNQSLNGDVNRDLGQANPQALELYNKADGMWRDMSQLRQQVVQRLIGRADNPLSGEQTMTRVTQMMSNKGDLGRFNRTMNMMTPQEQADFRASLWENIGQRSPEEGFTPAQFLAQTKNMQVGALKTVFGDNGAQSVQNLRVAASALDSAQKSLNVTKSGFVQNFKSTIGSIMSLKSSGPGLAGYAVAGLPGAAAAVVGSEVAQRAFNGFSARALMNTDVSSWIRKAATVKTTAQAQAMLGKLNTLAVGNASIQPEIAGFRDMLTKALNDNAPAAGSAAASPNSGPNQQQ